MNITIRKGTKADAVMIAALSRQTFYDTFAIQNTKEDMEQFLAEQFTTQSLINEVGAPGNTFLLAYCNNAIAGYARLLEHTNTMEIARLYVTANYIGTGVGKALMQACIEEAIQKSKKNIWLGVWEANTRAINFYTAWGFKKVGTQPFTLGTDVQQDWLMQKEI